jgi:hypothetical protein
MKIYAVCLVKNEDDVVRQSLLAASEWADKIFVYDNASSDNTWKIVQELAKTNDRIIPWKSDDKHYKNNLFGDIFNNFRSIAKDGDWWCWLPGDEFYIDNPVEFLSKVPKRYHVVKHESIDYHLTFEDVEEYEFKDGEEFDASKVRYYNRKSYTENRFFRHRDRLVWPAGHMHPLHIGIVYPEKIKVRHYQHRSPQQIQMRLNVRRVLVETGYKFFKHAAQNDWKEKLVHRSELVEDKGDGNWQIEEIRYDVKPKFYLDIARRIAHFLKIFP